MPIAEDVLRVARAELGYREGTNNANKYGAAYGMNNVAWCMQFCWWVFREAGASSLIHPKTAYTPTAASWHRARGTFSTTPRVGSLVFFDWPDSVHRIQHVGIVEVVEANAVVVIEGNTQSGTAGNQSDGGGVCRRRRARNSSIAGYGHPAYTTSAARAPSVAITARPAAARTAAPGGFLMALSDAEQAEALALLRTLNAQITGDVDGAGPDGWGWPSWRYGPDHGKPITPVDMLRTVDAAVASPLDLTGRPGKDSDNLFGHVLSMRAELRQLSADLAKRITAVETALANAGVDPDLVRKAFTSAFGAGLTITGVATPANLSKGN
jgi:hypothetical protein